MTPVELAVGIVITALVLGSAWVLFWGLRELSWIVVPVATGGTGAWLVISHTEIAVYLILLAVAAVALFGMMLGWEKRKSERATLPKPPQSRTPSPRDPATGRFLPR